MDPLATLITLVGLICNWKQERGSQDQEKFQSFILWLENHNFQNLKSAILESGDLTRELNDLLRSDIASLGQKLDLLGDAVAAISTRIQGISGLAGALGEKSVGLSDQACAILIWFHSAGSDRYIVFHHPGQTPSPYRLYAPRGGSIYPSESQFFPDDMAALDRFGYIHLVDHTGDGNPIYAITRAGGRFAVQLSEAPPT